jgi:hypothetical protein
MATRRCQVATSADLDKRVVLRGRYGSPFEAYKLTPRRAIRRMMEHNAKVIHGVPKHQLLVWDVHR